MKAPAKLSSTERRAAIIKAVRRVFAEKGFDGTTTRELADAALAQARSLGAQHADFRAERLRGQREADLPLARGLAALRLCGPAAARCVVRGGCGHVKHPPVSQCSPSSPVGSGLVPPGIASVSGRPNLVR